ncbi:MAG: hypothetical protein WA996_13060 [Candidatus Promineifilaceae bacterium]
MKLFATGFNGPFGMDIDHMGDLYYSAFNLGEVLRIDATDQCVSKFLSGITTPRGLVFDSRERLYIAAYESSAIHRAIGCQQ